MAKSIIQDEKVCYLTGRGDNLEEHHVYYGTGNRKLSEKYGLKIYLTAEKHRNGKDAVHCNRELDMKIKAEVQEKAMEHYGWDVEDFRYIFGKSYV